MTNRACADHADNFVAGLKAVAARDWSTAECCFRAAVIENPGSADALGNLGATLLQLGRAEEAIPQLSAALALYPGSADLLANLAAAQVKLGRYSEAVEIYEKAVRLASDRPRLFADLGRTQAAMGKVDEAAANLGRAVSMVPGDLALQVDLARVLKRGGRHVEAERLLGDVLIRDSGNALASLTLATVRLARGEYLEAWELYETRFAATGSRAQPYPWPSWRGESLSGRSIVARCEQGFGDIIQFSRYLPLLKSQHNAAHVSVVVPPPLRSLLGTMPGIDQVLTEGDQLMRHDCWVWMGSLPLRFGTTVATVPCAVPYIQANAELAGHWEERMPRRFPRVGFAWAGASHTPGDQLRSLPSINVLAPVLAASSVAFVSLQRDREAEIVTSAFGVTPVGDALQDFADAAAVIDRLDLIVTVDTAYAHLAAAMGKPTFILLGANPDWRWMTYRSDSPWYPTVRIYRQEAPGSWEAVVLEVAKAVHQFGQECSAAPLNDALERGGR